MNRADLWEIEKFPRVRVQQGASQTIRHESWHDFVKNGMGDQDNDKLNVLIRWDWVESAAEELRETDTLLLTIAHPRLGTLSYVSIAVKKAEEEAVRLYTHDQHDILFQMVRT